MTEESLSKINTLLDGLDKSEATLRAYKADFHHFASWCQENSFEALPADPDVVALYILALEEQGYAHSTIARRKVAINCVHEMIELDSPIP